MTALLESNVQAGAGGATPNGDNLTAGLYGKAAAPLDASAAALSSGTADAIKSIMPELVKGAGFSPKGGNLPLTDQADITLRAHQATLDLRTAIWQGYHRKSEVVQKGFKPDFLNQFGALRTALTMPSIGEQLEQFMGALASPDVVRSFTAGNLGIGSIE